MKEQLTEKELLLLGIDYNKSKRSMLVAYLLVIFLGTLGIDKFYLKKNIQGLVILGLTVVGTLTTWLFIGYVFLGVVSVILFINLFTTYFSVDKYNEEVEKELVSKIIRAR